MEGAAAKAFDDAYRAHAAACRGYASALPGDPDDATHEAFVKLCRRLAAGGSMPTNPRAWLLAAVRTNALDARRAERRRHRREQFAFEPRVEATLPDPAVHDALWRIDERRREAVVLRLWCDASFADVAELMGVAISTAHDLYRRGLDDLRDLLKDEA